MPYRYQGVRDCWPLLVGDAGASPEVARSFKFRSFPRLRQTFSFGAFTLGR